MKRQTATFATIPALLFGFMRVNGTQSLSQCQNHPFPKAELRLKLAWVEKGKPYDKQRLRAIIYFKGILSKYYFCEGWHLVKTVDILVSPAAVDSVIVAFRKRLRIRIDLQFVELQISMLDVVKGTDLLLFMSSVQSALFTVIHTIKQTVTL